MAEYIEREALLEKARGLAGGVFGTPRIIVAIKNAPTADVVEVVRCKDCKHFGKNKKYRNTKFPISFCDKFHHNITRGNDFCSYGEKKEGAEE